ncbi:MAG: hypothetical protein PHC68_17515 [Syntrophorhabdaceae bacterium]|nr:hypothetical protein [Syntrophorhabdaceae bacterium]
MKKYKKKVYWPKFFQRKFLLMTAIFIMAQIMKWQGKIGDIPWIVASALGVFGFAVIRLYFERKNEG